MKMLCRKCNIQMFSGTSYEDVNGKKIAKRYDECPKCHFRKYNNGKNRQEKVEIKRKK